MRVSRAWCQSIFMPCSKKVSLATYWMETFYSVFLITCRSSLEHAHIAPMARNSKLNARRQLLYQSRLLQVLESPWIFFPDFQGLESPWKDMVLESPWIYVWRSLKVLEFDFLKRLNRTSWYWKKVFQMASFLPQMCIKSIFVRGSTPDTTGGAYDAYICL